MGEDLIIRNVTLIDGSGGPPMPNTEVAIQDGRFAAIRPSDSGTNGATVFDGRGGYLVPGLWEGHTHLRARPDEPQADQVVRLETILADYLAAGITTVLELGGPLDIGARLHEHRQITPPTGAAELYFAGPSFTGINGWPLELHHNHSLVRETGDAQSARRMVLELAGQIDFIKCMYDGEPGAPDKLPRAALEAIVTAAHERGKSVLVHIATKRDIEEAVDAGADCIEHTFLPRDPDDLSEAEEVANLLARTGTYFSPTLAIFEQIGRNGDRAYLDDLVRDAIISADDADVIAGRGVFGAPFPHHPAGETLTRFQYGMRSLPIMHAAGVKIVAGSDVALFMSRPAALLRELQLLAQAGLPNGQVIVAASRHAAEKIGMGKSVGTIAVGHVADALVLDADPLADVLHLVRSSHRTATVRRGHLSAAHAVPPAQMTP
jgi:imidazolonepropionase-like amidohydrolase